MRTVLFSSSFVALALVSCSSPVAPATLSATIAEDRIEVRTGDFVIPPGDSFECFYTPLVTDRDLTITHGLGEQMEGGHHLIVYYTPVMQEVGHHPCIESEMASWRQLAAADPTTGETSYSVAGLGMRIPAGSQIVVQAHYINLREERTVNDWVDVLFPRPGEVRALAGTLVVDDEAFELPPRQGFREVGTCRVPEDTQVASLIGHMHEHGSHYRLERLAADGTPEVLYDFDWATSFASHPPIQMYGLDHPMVLPAGTVLRQTCEWRNDSSESVIFPREMCVAYMNTFPSEDGAMVFCVPISQSGEAIP